MPDRDAAVAPIARRARPATTLHRRLDGPRNAPVLVLSNSLGTTLELWAANVTAWAGALRLVRYDQRGHGQPDAPAGPYTIEQLGLDVLALLDELQLERVSFCGLSLGGATGLWLAANANGRIDRLVLACTSARFGDPEPWLERASIVRQRGVEAVADGVVSRWFTPRFAAEHPGLVSGYREMLLTTPAEGYAGACEAIAGWDFRDRLGSIAASTLVLSGADDPATPPEHGRLLADGIPGAELVVLPEAAHLANVEQPDAFAALVVDHLREAA
jgi:3-oxoadipate enol-lactonase